MFHLVSRHQLLRTVLQGRSNCASVLLYCGGGDNLNVNVRNVNQSRFVTPSHGIGFDDSLVMSTSVRSMIPKPEGKEHRQDSKGRQSSADPFDYGKYLLFVIPLSTLCLGIWQVYRWQWKLSLIADMEKRVFAEPINLSDINSVDELDDLEYYKVKTVGRFDYNNQLMLGPRSLLKVDHSTKEFSPHGGHPGYHVITPFHLADRGATIMVNRGWVRKRHVETYNTGLKSGEIEIVGVLRKNEKKSPFMPKTSGQPGLHMYRNIETMAAELNTSPIFLDLVSIDGVELPLRANDATPVPMQTRITMRNEHVSYFITWFTLSVITGIMWRRIYVLKKPLL